MQEKGQVAFARGIGQMALPICSVELIAEPSLPGHCKETDAWALIDFEVHVHYICVSGSRINQGTFLQELGRLLIWKTVCHVHPQNPCLKKKKPGMMAYVYL